MYEASVTNYHLHASETMRRSPNGKLLKYTHTDVKISSKAELPLPLPPNHHIATVPLSKNRAHNNSNGQMDFRVTFATRGAIFLSLPFCVSYTKYERLPSKL